MFGVHFSLMFLAMALRSSSPLWWSQYCTVEAWRRGPSKSHKFTMQRSVHTSSFQQPNSLTGVKREEVGCKIGGTEVVGIEL